MSDLDTPLLQGLDDTNCDDTSPPPGRLRTFTSSSNPFFDSIDSLLPVKGGVVLRRLLGVTTDTTNATTTNNDNDTNDIYPTTTTPTRNSTPPNESHPPTTITMNLNTNQNHTTTPTIPPDMEYDEHHSGDHEEETKSPSPAVRTLSLVSASSSITSSAMIVMDVDGMCTYAYYDEESWNGGVGGGGRELGATTTTPLHHNLSQQSLPHQYEEEEQQHHQRRRQRQQQQQHDTDDDDESIPRYSWRLRSLRTLQNPNGGGSVDSSLKAPFTGSRRFPTTDSECESSFKTTESMIPTRGAGNDGTGEGLVESALNKQNVLNFAFLVGNLVVVALVGAWKLNGRLRSLMDVWEEQQTLVSPSNWLLIWPAIALFETIFAFAQLTPSFRSRPIVQEGIGYFFVHTCLGQMGWMLFFSAEMFLPAFLSILYTLLSLISLKLSQDFVLGMHRPHTDRTNRTNPNLLRVGGLLTKIKEAEYWFLRFPFHFHLGWTVVVASVTLAIFVVQCGSSGVVELTASLVILSVWLLVAFFFVIVLAPEGGGAFDFTIPLVVILAYIGIGVALRSPSETLITRFNGDEISGLSATSFALAILVGLLVMPGVAFRIFREHFTINVTQVE